MCAHALHVRMVSLAAHNYWYTLCRSSADMRAAITRKCTVRRNYGANHVQTTGTTAGPLVCDTLCGVYSRPPTTIGDPSREDFL